jgi:hypothetical protein
MNELAYVNCYPIVIQLLSNYYPKEFLIVHKLISRKTILGLGAKK